MLFLRTLTSKGAASGKSTDCQNILHCHIVSFTLGFHSEHFLPVFERIFVNVFLWSSLVLVVHAQNEYPEKCFSCNEFHAKQLDSQ